MNPALILALAQAVANLLPTMQMIIQVVDKLKSGEAISDEFIQQLVSASQASDPAAFESLAKAAGLPWPPVTPPVPPTPAP
jgi:hypothetical protein